MVTFYHQSCNNKLIIAGNTIRVVFWTHAGENINKNDNCLLFVRTIYRPYIYNNI